MHISCEKCSTTYALDERVLPAGGAPVQCTRCGHVFIARPPQAEASSQSLGEQLSKGSTQIFGKPAAAPPPARSGTQIFGVPAIPPVTSSEPPASELGAAPKGATQIFGSSAAQARGSTQLFGSIPAATSAPVELPPKQSPGAPTRTATQMFGAPPSAGAQGQGTPTRAATQMFGVPAASTPPSTGTPPRASTQMFGAPAEPTRASTQMFGAPAEPPRSSTQMFGVPAEPPRSSTQMFGVPAATPGSAEAPPRASTQMFGTAGVSSSDSARRATPAETPTTGAPRAATQMFGAAAISSDEAQLPMESAPPAGAPDSSAPRAPTQMFGVPSLGSSPSGEAAPRASTQMFGVPAIESAEHATARASTQMFGAAMSALESDAEGEGAPADSGGVAPSTSTEVNTTAKYGTLGPGRSVTKTFSGGGAPAVAASKKAPIELPPEVPQMDMPLGASAVASAEGFEEELKGRNRMWLAALGLIAIGVATFFGVRTFLNRRAEIPVEWTAAREQAYSLLRRDDPGSSKQASSRLAELVEARPDYVEARADLVVALALQLDDSRIGRSHILAASNELNERIKKLQEAQDPSDWVTRVNAMREELIALDKKLEPLNKEAEAVDRQLTAAFNALQGHLQDLTEAEKLAVTRAEAVYFGVKGQSEALARSQAYETKGPKDGWAQIAYAEYALNSKGPPATLNQAKTQMDALREKDQTFLRPYVLSARLAFAQKQYDDAVSTLEAVAAMNRSHSVATALLDWVQENQRSESSR